MMNQLCLSLRLNKKWLLILPLAIYTISYIYLAIYHGTPWLCTVPVHESGDYTLFETMFYASHFIGHIPVLFILAILFLGIFFTFSESFKDQQSKLLSWVLLLVVFLVFSGVLSLYLFGWQDTVLFLKQNKQSQVVFVPGGSWLLHLPSTIMFFIFMPLYFFILYRLFGQTIQLSKNGIVWISAAIVGIVFMTCISTRSWNLFISLHAVWTSPRYLAHSVRELITFPLTMFPLPFYFLLEMRNDEKQQLPRCMVRILTVLGIVFFVLFFYQSIVPLMHGIGDLAQKPAFAHEGRLSIAYLFASHSFEHFLDTIFFLFVVMAMYEWKRFFMRRKVQP